MESFPGPHNYMRPPLPPPPSMADPHHHQPPPPGPPQGPPPSWYSPQFQYHHSSHSPSPPPQPPPPHQQQWAPPPPYAPHPYPNQYPPPQRPQMPSFPPPPSYANSNQDWVNPNWGPHPGWEHQAHSNGDDWAAKARAWAAAKNAVENQHQPMQSQYPSQYMPTSDTHYHDNPATAYYAPDGNFSYARKDGNFPEMGSTYPQQDAFTSPSVHKQEVPSSYSSIPGGQISIEQQRNVSGGGDSMLADQSQFSYGNHSVVASNDLSDQPLQFTPRFNHDNNPMMLAGYSDPANAAKVMDPATPVPTLQPWTPPAPASISFPSASPAFPSAAQLDPTISMPPLSGQLPPMPGRPSVPSFHSTVSSLSSPIGLGTGTSIHPATAFHGDMYGNPMNPERPKKAAVPNWLRDEIIKKKDVIVSSGTEYHKEESESIDDEAVDKFVGKSDQADSKSVDSSRSTEEEDEDYEDVARTAAVNQEIKRVLTEVLLKVTSELFDEIATRVLSEGGDSLEAKNDTSSQNEKQSSLPAASVLKVSEKVLSPAKSKEPKYEDVNEESSSGAAGAVLGLVNYASDDDDDEIGSSIAPKSDKRSEIMSLNNKNIGEGMKDTVEISHLPPDSEKNNKNLDNAGNNHSVASLSGTEHNHCSKFDDLVDRRSDKNGTETPQLNNPTERTDAITGHGRVIGSLDVSRSNSFSRKEANEPEAPTDLVRKASKDDFREKDTRRNDRHEDRSSSGRDSVMEAEIIDPRANSKGEQVRGKHDERHQRKKNEDRNGSKERSKEQGVKYGEKAKEDSKKRSPRRHTKEITKEVERLQKAREKDYSHRRSERSKDEKSDRSRHKHAHDRSRHKRRRSSSVDSRDRNSKDNSLTSYSDNSADEASEKSRRKTHSRRRDLSPSPVPSRRRQVSQSPPSSKASQRRQSPYSSLEASRGKRSRSRSPAHRRR